MNIQSIYLHSTVVLLKVQQLIELRHYLLHLHSTVVLLKGWHSNRSFFHILDLHSTVVLLKDNLGRLI